MDFEMDLELLRDKSGNLRGFSVVSKPHTQSETFCDTFPRALLQRDITQADVIVRDGRLYVVHPTSKYKGECSFPLSAKDAKELHDFLELQGKFEGKKLSIITRPIFLDGKLRNFHSWHSI